jgi:hypothetical protein
MNKLAFRVSMLTRRCPMHRIDNSRIQLFRQFKKEIKRSAEYMILGMDTAKEKHHAFFGTARGKSSFRVFKEDPGSHLQEPG